MSYVRPALTATSPEQAFSFSLPWPITLDSLTYLGFLKEPQITSDMCLPPSSSQNLLPPTPAPAPLLAALPPCHRLTHRLLQLVQIHACATTQLYNCQPSWTVNSWGREGLDILGSPEPTSTWHSLDITLYLILETEIRERRKGEPLGPATFGKHNRSIWVPQDGE